MFSDIKGKSFQSDEELLDCWPFNQSAICGRRRSVNLQVQFSSPLSAATSSANAMLARRCTLYDSSEKQKILHSVVVAKENAIRRRGSVIPNVALYSSKFSEREFRSTDRSPTRRASVLNFFQTIFPTPPRAVGRIYADAKTRR